MSLLLLVAILGAAALLSRGRARRRVTNLLIVTLLRRVSLLAWGLWRLGKVLRRR